MSLQCHEYIGDLPIEQYEDLPIDGNPWVPMDNTSLINVSDYIQSKKQPFSLSSYEAAAVSISK